MSILGLRLFSYNSCFITWDLSQDICICPKLRTCLRMCLCPKLWMCFCHYWGHVSGRVSVLNLGHVPGLVRLYLRLFSFLDRLSYLVLGYDLTWFLFVFFLGADQSLVSQYMGHVLGFVCPYMAFVLFLVFLGICLSLVVTCLWMCLSLTAACLETRLSSHGTRL